MKCESNERLSPVLFIPHGGGPLPLLGDKSHQHLVNFLRAITPSLGQPSAILVVSAHWEENIATITSGETPSLIFDYDGFPDESYQIQYPAPGAPDLADKIFRLLHQSDIEARLDPHRGFDHGLFVPLKIMFPDAKIPCVQLSLIHDLDPETHIDIGKALSELRKENVLIIGSGFSFHNLKAFFTSNGDSPDAMNAAFEDWLINTCTNGHLSANEREYRLIHWRDAPYANYCHPREEHLLPLHVCMGLSSSFAKLVFDGEVLGKKASAFLW
ncbi:class III extradiol ring-cleavage dioxygenase [Methylobacter sp. G7]|uniref:DODA-type extradiol aromatic ring-opening family dioxygenase n=1 Tax=Methylobacter sp. G7 TaxID=3230117 RepID=UPI003D805D0E